MLFGSEGEGLSMDVLETLVKVAPTADEKKKFMQFDGSLLSLGPPDRFFHALLHVPNAFPRLSAMLYRAQYEEEMKHVQEAIRILEVSIRTGLFVHSTQHRTNATIVYSILIPCQGRKSRVYFAVRKRVHEHLIGSDASYLFHQILSSFYF